MTDYNFIDPDKPDRAEKTEADGTEKAQQEEQQEDSRGFFGRAWDVLRG